MTQFVALVWDDRDATSLAVASRARERVTDRRDWSALTDHAGLAIYIRQRQPSSQQTILLQQDAGVILGTVFDRSASPIDAVERTPSIDARTTADILRTNGQSLVESHWGSYILFLRRPQERTISVLRGPVGTLACYYLTHHRCTLLVSNAADLSWLYEGVLSINWDCIRGQAAAGDFLTQETALSEVAATICGQCLEIHDGQIIHRSYWTPSSAPCLPVTDFYEAAASMFLETHRCVSAWASLHDTVLLSLSGGLDSSVVLSYLQYPPHRTRVVAVNFYSEGSGDERRFARSMAERTDTPLEEIPSNCNIDLRNSLRCALTASPVQNFTAFDTEPVLQKVARAWNATAIFTGEAGDDVLGHAPSPEALTEILQHPEQLHRFVTAALDFAELTRISVWRAMHLANQHRKWLRQIKTWSAYRHRRLAGQSDENSLVSDEAMRAYEDMIPRFTHPWFQDANSVPPGKAMLIHSIIEATSSVSESPFTEVGSVPMMSPLISQPLLEAVLRIPSYMHFSRAENGAVARAAFRMALSPLVLNRGTGKGAPAVWARRLLDANVGFLSELLLDGLLAQRGILDRVKLQTLLSKEISRTRLGMAELIRQVYIEMWLRRWAEAGVRL